MSRGLRGVMGTEPELDLLAVVAVGVLERRHLKNVV